MDMQPSTEPYEPELIEKPNTNFRARPAPPDGILLHSMGQYIASEFAGDFLERIGLSAHYLIDHKGIIYECVDPEQQAYHAGKSKFRGQTGLNKTFIGIELLIKGDHTYSSFLEAIKKESSFTDLHYKSLTWLCRKLMPKHGVPIDRITLHSSVSGIDVRPDPKQDPGEGFQLDRLLGSLEDENTV